MRPQDEIEFLAELSRVVASSPKLHSVLEWIVHETPARLSADGGSIKLTGDDDVTVTVIRRRDGIGSWPQAITMSVMGYLMSARNSLTTSDILTDPRFPGLKDVESPVRAILALPMQVGNRIIGMLGVGCRALGRHWSEQEVRLMEIVAAHSGKVIELIQQRQRTDELQQDMVLAGKLQQGLVPAQPLRVGPWEILGRVVPARHVGGDYYDYFVLDRDRFGVAIADVVGKGFPAAMLVSCIKVLVRLGCDGRRPLGDAFAEMNSYLARRDDPGQCVTLFFGEMDVRRGLMRYVRAGHNYPLVRRRDGDVEEMKEGERPLGMFEDIDYQEGQVQMEDGDAILLYTDGVTEALGPDGEFFGEERLCSLWRRCPAHSPRQAIEEILEHVRSFRGAVPQSDDIAIVIVASKLE